jgi:nitrile hydratase accessory protein
MVRPVADKPFEIPWHAQAFALAVALNEAGLFRWEDWTRQFGEQLLTARAARDAALDGADDYYLVWLETLVTIIQRHDAITPELLQAVEDQWRAAYLSTPHGQPVRIASPN